MRNHYDPPAIMISLFLHCIITSYLLDDTSSLLVDCRLIIQYNIYQCPPILLVLCCILTGVLNG